MRGRLFRWGGLLLLWLLLPLTVRAATPVLLLAQGSSQISLAGHLARHVDADGTQTYAEVATNAVFDTQPGFGSGGYTPAVHWYRFTLARAATAPTDWVLELGPAYLDDIRVYVQRANGSLAEYRLGDHVPYAERPLQTRLHTLRISLADERPKTFYVRVASNSALAFFGRILPLDTFTEKESVGNYLHGIFFGVLLLTVVMYSIMGLWLRDANLLVYVAYVSTLLLLYLGINGYGAVLFAPADGRWLDAITGIGVIGGGITGILMWDRFLDLPQHFPRIHRLTLALAILMTLGLASVASPYYRLIAPIGMPLAIGLTWIFIGLLIWRMINEPRQPMLAFYLCAFLAATLGIAAQYGMAVGLLPLNWMTANSYQIGSLAHVLVLNIALAWRVKRMEKERFLAEQVSLRAIEHASEQRQLVAMLSHEFRNPLASISRSAQMLLLNPKGDEARRIGSIRETADGLYALIDKFLASESLDYKKSTLLLEELPLRPLLGEAIRGLEAESRMHIAISPKDATFTLDHKLFVIAIGNLIANALRYSPANSPVELNAEVNNNGLHIAVTDHGAGLSSDELKQLGTPYFRGASTEQTPGIGLGFVLARRIIHAHGGTIDVSSVPGQGATVNINVPDMYQQHKVGSTPAAKKSFVQRIPI